MKVVDTIEAEQTGTQRIQIPSGLLGLEHIKEYELIAVPAEDPFIWLQSAGVPDVAFLLVSPFLVVSDYQPDISDNDMQALGLQDPAGALLYNIVTVRGSAPATVNLKGPVVINRATKVAKQVVLNNAADYSVHHPIVAS
jgi:flagellar assembly factor FliW